jgi:hypothetical protein
MVWEAAVCAARFQGLAAPVDSQFQATGYFRFDFLNACKIIGLEPHPFIRRGLQFGPPPSAGSGGKPAAPAAPAAKPVKGAPPPGPVPEVPPQEKMHCISIDIRGFELDAGTVHALWLALPACASLQSFKFVSCF